MRGVPAPDTQARANESIGHLAIDEHHLELAQHAEMSRLSGFLRELFEDRTGLPQKAAVSREGLPDLEAASAEPITIGSRALLYVPRLLERGEQPKHVVLVQVEAVGELRYAELFFVGEGLEQRERIAHRLDHVIALASFHRRPLGVVAGDWTGSSLFRVCIREIRQGAANEEVYSMDPA